MHHAKCHLRIPAYKCIFQILAFIEAKLSISGPLNQHNFFILVINATKYFGPIYNYIRLLANAIFGNFLV